MKYIFSKIRYEFKVELKIFPQILEYTFKLLSRKRWVLLFTFAYKFKVFPSKSDGFGLFYDKHIQSLIHMVMIKKPSIWNKKLRIFCVGKFDGNQL